MPTTAPYTHNVVYKDVIRMIFRGTTDGPGSADAASEVEPSDPPEAATAPGSSAVDPDAMAGQISSDLPAHVEFVDLTDAEQAQLHRALLQGTVSAPPEETGADSSGLATQTRRAREAGVMPSEWYAVSHGVACRAQTRPGRRGSAAHGWRRFIFGCLSKATGATRCFRRVST